MSTYEDDLRQIRSTGQNDEGYQPPVLTDEMVNGDAVSFGCRPSPASTPVSEGGLPCMVVAGVTVWLYRQEGVMRISVDTDMADETTPGHQDGEPTVPMQVDVNGMTVWEAS